MQRFREVPQHRCGVGNIAAASGPRVLIGWAGRFARMLMMTIVINKHWNDSTVCTHINRLTMIIGRISKGNEHTVLWIYGYDIMLRYDPVSKQLFVNLHEYIKMSCFNL